MTLRDMMARHARTTLVRRDHHGEDVTYTPAGGEPSAPFLAVVNRLDLEALEPDIQAVVRLTANVFLPRHATLGVLQVNPGDTMTLALRLGGTAIEARVRRIIEQDEGGWLVEVAG